MSANKSPVNRILVGAIALACLGASVTLRMTNADNDFGVFPAALQRVGIVMAAFWLALPTKSRPAAWQNLSPWQFAGAVGAVAVLAWKPRIGLPFIGLLLVIAIINRVMRPAPKYRPPRREN